MAVTATFVSVPATLLSTLERHPTLARAMHDLHRLDDLADDLDLETELVSALRHCATQSPLHLGKAWDAARRVLHSARGFRKNPADVFVVGRHFQEENVSILSVRDVARVARLLSKTPRSTLRARGSRAQLDSEPPYPFSAGASTKEVLDYAMEGIENLREFFERTVGRSDGAVRWME